jgi:hypothetical protein
MSPRRRRLLIIVAGFLVEPILLLARGYPIGGNIVVRCRDGHLYTTLWIPSVTVKALRLGWWRFQRCPVGQHWSIVTPVKESELSALDRWRAARYKDLPIP